MDSSVGMLRGSESFKRWAQWTRHHPLTSVYTQLVIFPCMVSDRDVICPGETEPEGVGSHQSQHNSQLSGPLD